jgi:hypothetical protein
MATFAGLQDSIIFDYFVNYVFPQYALPWNNFFARIDPEPYYLRNEQRNTTARLFKTPLVVASKPNLVLQNSTLPDWVASLSSSASTGSSADQSSTKSFLGTIVNSNCTGADYQYANAGLIVGAGPQGALGSKVWVILQFNLANQNPKNNLSVVIVSDNATPTPNLYSSVNGLITVDGTIIKIKNAIPWGPGATTDPTDAIVSGASNALYGLYGNRFFLAVQTGNPVADNASIGYQLGYRICESITLAQAIGTPILG